VRLSRRRGTDAPVRTIPQPSFSPETSDDVKRKVIAKTDADLGNAAGPNRALLRQGCACLSSDHPFPG
jgi:hypothetical protein